MSDLIHLMYKSIGNQEFSSAQLTDMLKQARAHNARMGLTGMLIYSETDHSFFQVLEGDAASIDQLYARIVVDPRHRAVALLVREPIHRRSFASWSMGFTSLTLAELKGIPAVSDFFGAGNSLSDLDLSWSNRLLGSFAA